MRTAILAAAATLIGCAPPPLFAQDPALARSVDTLRIRTSAATALYFDLTPDGRTIVIDLLGQLWTVPVAGGQARLVADTVAVGAEDRQPRVIAGWPLGRHALRPRFRPRHLTPRPRRSARPPAHRLRAHSRARCGRAGWSPTGGQLAFSDDGAIVLLVQPLDGTAMDVTSEPGIDPRRVRWTRDGRSLVYVAHGRMRRVGLTGGPITEIPFTADLAVPRPRYARRAPHLAVPGAVDSARGFSGLAMAPDGERIGMLALGKLWLIDRQGRARVAASVPVSANGLTWSPDG